MNNHILGYIAVDLFGNPYQPTLGSGWWTRKKPITVYQSEKYAAKFTGIAIPVYTRDVNE